MLTPPIHLKIFIRDLVLNLKFSGDGDICQGMFEDYILHSDEKSPPMKRGHYSRNAAQIAKCLEYIEFCMERHPGSFIPMHPLLPITSDSSRLNYTLPKKVDGVDNPCASDETVQAFLAKNA